MADNTLLCLPDDRICGDYVNLDRNCSAEQSISLAQIFARFGKSIFKHSFLRNHYSLPAPADFTESVD